MTDDQLLKIYCNARRSVAWNDLTVENWQRQEERAKTLAGLRAVVEHVCPSPVAVNERPWERPGWFNSENRCWLFDRGRSLMTDPSWSFAHKCELEEIFEAERNGHKALVPLRAACLPHWAFPIPGQLDHFPGAGEMVDQLKNHSVGINKMVADQQEPSKATRFLSPAAQAVVDAIAAQAVMDAMRQSYDHEPTRRAIAAEILRAAVLNVFYEETFRMTAYEGYNQALNEITAIAAELEGQGNG